MFTDLGKISVQPDLTIKQAVQVLNDGHQRIVLIVDGENRLLGVLADSDIRKSIIKGLSFDLPVSEIMMKQPVVATARMSDSAILSLMQTTKCYEIPVLDDNRKVLGLKKIDSLVAQEQLTEVIIMAGGAGTRLRPITEDVPKPLIPVGGKPILFILLDSLISAGLRRITIALNYKADMIRKAVAAIPEYATGVRFVEEKERLGTVGALSLLETQPTAPFFVVNADLLTTIDFKAMIHFHQAEDNQVTMAVREKDFQIPFGVVELKGTRVLNLEEKPVQSFFVNAGVYILDPSLLSLIPANCFFDMPDLINAAITSGMQVGTFPIHEYWLDIGRHSELEQANQDASSVFEGNHLIGGAA